MADCNDKLVLANIDRMTESKVDSRFKTKNFIVQQYNYSMWNRY